MLGHFSLIIFENAPIYGLKATGRSSMRLRVG